MDTVFSHIVQKRFSRINEDVATDALAFILNSSESARNGFMKLLRGIESALPELHFRTQVSENNIRPDMWGFDGSDPRVFVENKFWAGLTENQPVSYLRQLSEFTQPTVLMVVVPAAREQTIWRELLTRLSAADISLTNREPPAGVVSSASTELGPILAITSWPKLLSALELESSQDQRVMGDLSQLRSLCVAADSQAFVPISGEETSDQRTPALILQLNMIVQDSVQLAVTRGVIEVKNLGAGTASDRIGRYIRFCGKARVEPWIGIHFELWNRHGVTPIWLVFWQSEFGRAMEVKRVLEPWTTKGGAISSSENDYFALGLELVTSEEKDLVVESIVDDLKRVATALSALPPVSYSAGPSDE